MFRLVLLFLASNISPSAALHGTWLPWNLSAPWYMISENHPFSPCLNTEIVERLGLLPQNTSTIGFPAISVFDHNGLCLSESCLHKSDMVLSIEYSLTPSLPQCNNKSVVEWVISAQNSSNCKFPLLRGCNDLSSDWHYIDPLFNLGFCHDFIPTINLTHIVYHCNFLSLSNEDIYNAHCHGSLDTSRISSTLHYTSTGSIFFSLDVNLEAIIYFEGPPVQFSNIPFVTIYQGPFAQSKTGNTSLIPQSHSSYIFSIQHNNTITASEPNTKNTHHHHSPDTQTTILSTFFVTIFFVLICVFMYQCLKVSSPYTSVSQSKTSLF